MCELTPRLLVQVNVVVMRGLNDSESADFVELTRAFIEHIPLLFIPDLTPSSTLAGECCGDAWNQ